MRRRARAANRDVRYLQIFKLPCVPHVVNRDSGVKLALIFTHSSSVSHGKTQYIEHVSHDDVARHAPPHAHSLECSHVPPLGVHCPPVEPLDELLDEVGGGAPPRAARQSETARSPLVHSSIGAAQDDRSTSPSRHARDEHVQYPSSETQHRPPAGAWQLGTRSLLSGLSAGPGRQEQ